MTDVLMWWNNTFSYRVILETPKETGFHQSMRICLEQIRDALLHHRWQEAAEYMACYPQMLEDTTSGKQQQYKKVGLLLLFICVSSPTHIDF